jgi:hypothetical protein
MKKYFIVILLTLFMVGGFWCAKSPKLVESASVGPQIIIAQIKITSSNGQFITLYNNTNAAIDLSTIQLQYFNSFDLLKATSGKLISLSGKVPAHGYAVVDDGPIQACYQMTVNSVSLGLSSTAGFVQVAHFLGTTSPQVVSILDDYVAWSKTPATGAQTLPSSTSAFLQRKAPDNTQNYAGITVPGLGNWAQVQQLDGSSPCAASSANVGSGSNLLTTDNSPIPYTVLASPAALSSIPVDDAGLAAPKISEVLPNPASPQTDENDEFIELYNSNDKAFDLSGFVLQVGTTTVHTYRFPDGSSIEPHKFSAFYSSDTNLSLSNNDGQVKLLDPDANVLSQTDEYTAAKDGYAWVNADGLWQWTTTLTPNATNIITAPPTSKKTSKAASSSAKTSSKGKVKAAKTTNSNQATANNGVINPPSATKMHPLVLVGVGAAALLYALYEYRNDLANALYKLRRNREIRRATG